LKVALTYNLKPVPARASTAAVLDDAYAEWDDPATIAAVHDALATECDVVLIEDGKGVEHLLRATRPDMVFNLAEGYGGPDREAVIPTLLQRLGIPFTGSSARTLRLCLDKAATKRVLRQHGLPTPDYMVVARPELVPEVSTFPLIVKPLHEGSSKGVYSNSVVYDQRALRMQIQWVVETYKQPALVETFLPGREFTIAVLGNSPHLTVLPLVEICFAALPTGALPIYSYEAKWLWDTVERPLDILCCPAEVETTLARTLYDLCRRAFLALACRDWCRIDLRLDADGRPFILEVNPLPGILPHPDSHSCFPKAAAAAGLPYPDLIRCVLRLACERYGLPV
jgi:D-alanine-D-alanine ligase